jgi:hypothetical protein
MDEIFRSAKDLLFLPKRKHIRSAFPFFSFVHEGAVAAALLNARALSNAERAWVVIEAENRKGVESLMTLLGAS